MKRANKSWMAVVAAALLLGTLVGVVWARPNDRSGAADITRKVVLAPADFTPTQESWNYLIGESAQCDAGACVFAAPVVFPTLGAVTVERIKLHVTDNNGSAYAVATLYRKRPGVAGADVELGVAQSPPGTSPAFETFTSPDINKVVWPSQRAWVHLQIGAEWIYVHGVTVEYHRNM